MNKIKLPLIAAITLMAISVNATFVEVQNEMGLRERFSAQQERSALHGRHVNAFLTHTNFYNKATFENKSLADKMPIYLLSQNKRAPKSSYEEVVRSFNYDFKWGDWLKQDDWMKTKRSSPYKEIINVLEVPTIKTNLNDACVFTRKCVLLCRNNEDVQEQYIYFQQNVFAYANGRFLESAILWKVKTPEEMQVMENHGLEMAEFLKKNALRLPSCDDKTKEASSLKEEMLTREGTTLENNTTKQIDENAKGEYYITPPGGMCRGLFTVLLSPFNYFRSIPLAVNVANNNGDADVGIFYLPFCLCAETAPVIGDVLLGALDMISFGVFGNDLYGDKYTPWFWERDNTKPWLTK